MRWYSWFYDLSFMFYMIWESVHGKIKKIYRYVNVEWNQLCKSNKSSVNIIPSYVKKIIGI